MVDRFNIFHKHVSFLLFSNIFQSVFPIVFFVRLPLWILKKKRDENNTYTYQLIMHHHSPLLITMNPYEPLLTPWLANMNQDEPWLPGMNHYLFGCMEHLDYFSTNIGNVIIPTDFHILRWGRYTTNQLFLL